MRSVTVTFVLGLLAVVAVPRPAAATDCASHDDCGSFQLCIDGACVEVEPTGETCEGDADCGDGLCLDGFCYAPGGAPVPVCTSDADCGEGGTCMEGVCMYEHVPECETDADCGEGGVCLEGGFCSFDGGEAPTSCESDADCTAEQICVWNMCMEKEYGYCHTDDDCGSGMVCNGCYCESSEGTCTTDEDCGEYETCQTVESMGVEPAAPGAAEGDECQYTHGWCLLDMESIPTNPRCDAFCAAVTPCEGEATSGGGGAAGGGGSGGSASEEMALESEDEECAKFCAYLLLEGDGQDEAESLVGCVEQNADAGCDALFEACSEEVDATAAAFDDTYTGVDAGEAPAGGGEPGGEGGGTTRNSLGDTLAAAFGKGGLAGGGDGGDGGDGDGGSGATDDGGAAACSFATTPATGAAALLALLFLALGILRRQRA